MGRSERPVPDGPLKEFAEGLRALRQSQKLTYRQLSQRARYSYSVLSTAASGNALPTLEVTLAYVGACKGDTAEWEERWNRIAVILRATDPGLLPAEALGQAATVDAADASQPHKPGSQSEDWAAGIEPAHPDGPRRIGTFHILGRLGAGATSEVYLAAGPSGRPAAVKVIRPQFARDPLFCRRFARELAAARKIDGDHTAAVIDADAYAEQPWMASEYLAGPSLAEVVANGGPLPAAAVLALATGICEALRAFHAAGVVHRDLKPTNVLLTDQGPRVIDFGIAHCLDATALTATGTQIGTAGFMAPEQAEGGEVTPAADVFALGCLLAYAATGRAPFGAGSSASLLYRVVHDEPDEKAVACDDEQLRELIKRCLSKAPGERPTPEQIIDECTGSAATGPEWLPEAVAGQSVRLDAVAAALVKRAARRRVARRALTVSASLLAILVIIVTTVLSGGRGTGRDPGGRFANAAPVRPGGGRPKTGATPTLPANSGLVPAVQRLSTGATDAAGLPAGLADGSGTSGAASADPGVNPAPPTQEFYSFERSTDGWTRIGGNITLGSSSLFHYDRLYSLGLSDTSTDTAHVGVAAVTGLPDGPAAGTTISAWIYVPVHIPRPVQAGLYVLDSGGTEHAAAAVTLSAGAWQRLTYTTAGYSGHAQEVGLKFSLCGTVGATIFLDAVSWN